MKIINVMASSLDGRIGVHSREGDSERLGVGLSSESDQLLLRRHIETAEAIVVGASSIRSNGSCLDHPGSRGKPPIWFIFSRSPLPENYDFWGQTHIRRILVSQSPLPIVEGSGVESLVYGEQDPALYLRDHLRAQRLGRVLLFGGGVVNSWFYQHRLVDGLELTLAPLLIGQPDAPFLVAPTLTATVQFLLASSHTSQSFVFLSYSVIYS